MKTTLKLIIALVLAGAGIGQAWAEGEPPRYIGQITYKGEDDHGTLSFYHRVYEGKELSTGVALNANELINVLDDEDKLLGYRVYIYAQPEADYTVKGMTLEAELTTTVMQSRRNKAADSDASFDIGQKLTLKPVEGMPYMFEMVMPDDPNLSVTVTAKFAPKGKNKEPISYIDADGVTQTKEADDVYVMDGTEEKLAGWYVCDSTLSYKGTLKAVGDVHLILADGAAMSVEVPDGKAIDGGLFSLTIYGQSKGTGRLNVYSESKGIDAGGTVTINGGVVDVYGSYNGIAAGSVNINGGKVNAEGNYGYGIKSDGDITLGWNSADDDVWVTMYYSDMGSVKIADGKMLKYTVGSETVTLRGMLDAATIGNKELTPYGYGGYCGKASVNGGKNVVWEILAEDNAATTNIDESKTLNIIKNAEVTGQTDFSMADYDNDDASVAGNFAPWIKPSAEGNASVGLKYESVTAVNIGDGVTSIGQKAFEQSRDLTSVTIGKDVTRIVDAAFMRCGGLTSVTIGEGVNTIGSQAFMGCVGLTSVNIPASVTTIGDGAFSGCGELTTVTFNSYGSGITSLGSDVFDDCEQLKLILVPDEAAYNAYYKNYGWGEYKDKLAPQTLTVAKNASGWSTYCHRFPVSYSLSEGEKAYKVTGLSEDGKSVSLATADIEPCVPLLLNYMGGEGDVTLTAVPAMATTVEDGDIVSTGEGYTISGNMTGSNLKHTAADDGIPALTGVEDQTSYALYNGNLLRIDTDNGIDGHRWVLTVMGDAIHDVIALSTAEVTQGTGGGIGSIVYSKGEGDHGKLEFYASLDDLQDDKDELDLGADLNTNVLEEVKDDNEKVVGYRIYIYAEPDKGYTVKDKTLQAELTTSVQQSRRFDSAYTPTLQIGGAIGLTPVPGMPYIFTMVMPNDPNLNVTITATFAEMAKNDAAINYIDADGATKKKEAGSVYVLDGTEQYLGLYTAEEGVWYVCNSDLYYNRDLLAASDVHLILADGATMSMETDMGSVFNLGQNSLTIYGESTGAGSLNIRGDYEGIDAGGNVTINGGSLDVKSYHGSGIGAGGTVTINGGSLTVNAERIGIGAGDNVTINGGVVTANGNVGIIAGNVNINGGEVTANSTGENGNGISSGGDITLGWNSATDYITATNYYSNGSVKTADGKMLKYTVGSETVKLMGTLDDDVIADIADMTLTPYGIFGYCGKDNPATDDADESKNVTWEIPLVNGAPGGTLTISGTGEMADYDNDETGNFAPWIKPDKDGNASGGLKYESVTAVNIGDGVTYIGEKAFDRCYGLTSVTIGEDVTTIGYKAFYQCDGLTTVNIPASVTKISEDAFEACDQLTTVTVNRYVADDEDNPITALGGTAFSDKDNLTLILVPNEVAYNAYYGSDDYGWDKYLAMLAPQKMTLAKNASGWGTYCHRFHVSYSVDGATAYTVAGLGWDGKSVEIEEAKVIIYDDYIEEEVELTNHAAPATPLLLNYKGGEGDVTLTAVPATATKVEDGIAINSDTGFKFYGNPTADDLGADDCGFINEEGYNSYMLYDGEFVRIDENNGLAAHRCVLNVANDDGQWTARVLTIADGEATGIGSLKRPTPDPSLNGGEWYDLSGRRVNGQTVKKGVYINYGRKVVIK